MDRMRIIVVHFYCAMRLHNIVTNDSSSSNSESL